MAQGHPGDGSGATQASVDTLRHLGYRFDLAQPKGLVPMAEIRSLRNLIARPA